MPGPIETFMTADHARLDTLLRRAAQDDRSIDAETHALFREGLLRHIGMEEKILLPFARAKRAGEPLELGRALRKDHGAIAKLLVPTPTHSVCDELRSLLEKHNALEEGTHGLYAICDALAGDEAASVVDKLRAQPMVPVAKHYDGPLLRRN
jgi:hypothetical protein